MCYDCIFTEKSMLNYKNITEKQYFMKQNTINYTYFGNVYSEIDRSTTNHAANIAGPYIDIYIYICLWAHTPCKSPQTYYSVTITRFTVCSVYFSVSLKKNLSRKRSKVTDDVTPFKVNEEVNADLKHAS